MGIMVRIMVVVMVRVVSGCWNTPLMTVRYHGSGDGPCCQWLLEHPTHDCEILAYLGLSISPSLIWIIQGCYESGPVFCSCFSLAFRLLSGWLAGLLAGWLPSWLPGS